MQLIDIDLFLLNTNFLFEELKMSWRREEYVSFDNIESIKTKYIFKQHSKRDFFK